MVNYYIRPTGRDELYHHGILGMKWGVRRYQNPDGSYTAAGKARRYQNPDGSLTERGQKHYSRMSNDKLQKTLYKQVKKERAKQTDWSNQWNVTATIGKHSAAAAARYSRDRKKHLNSDEVVQANKKLRALDRKFEAGKMDYEEYEKEYVKVRKSVYKPSLDTSVRYGDKGREYSKAYLNKYGRELNIGYLKDLGYDDKTAIEFTDRILQSNRKLLNGM